ncbi:unnamed protein product, partial [Sphacelaria rigidula]
ADDDGVSTWATVLVAIILFGAMILLSCCLFFILK